jgi:hypothetical protein
VRACGCFIHAYRISACACATLLHAFAFLIRNLGRFIYRCRQIAFLNIPQQENCNYQSQIVINH